MNQPAKQQTQSMRDADNIKYGSLPELNKPFTFLLGAGSSTSQLVFDFDDIKLARFVEVLFDEIALLNLYLKSIESA